MDPTVADSKPFRFLVGPHGHEFTIHSALVAAQSPYLNTLVNGPFEEGNEGVVKWESVDEEAFLCFWQYSYAGDYHVPKEQDACADHEEDDATTSQGDSTAFAFADNVATEIPTEAKEYDQPVEEYVRASKNNKKRCKKCRSALYDEPEPMAEPKPKPFPSKGDHLWAVFINLRSRNVGLEKELLTESPGHHLLCHARVYVLADCYGISQLMEISYNKLHQAMCQFVLQTESLVDVIALIHYCYEELVPERLKKLVVMYTACKVETLWKDKQFQHILEEHGDFARAVIGTLISRLS
ncbi:BTB/POZ-like protein [Pochonia chlamydosporia 170]|uniref:BTB/POZ-like protein n=1 Tax=Pochonia chlamydosporia 170 TaxID=1380566 RepID=A0A179FR85_METCM|nr:BTB/POZ-like protein [Pochonia chlamydosporia 170]OAQ68112.1 BTB/POZ-like protein [Pochonia chlamydosporia 170]